MGKKARGLTKSLHSSEYAAFRELLVAARHKARLTQQAVAKQLGRPQSFVAKYERGERRLDVIDRSLQGPGVGSHKDLGAARLTRMVSSSGLPAFCLWACCYQHHRFPPALQFLRCLAAPNYSSTPFGPAGPVSKNRSNAKRLWQVACPDRMVRLGC